MKAKFEIVSKADEQEIIGELFYSPIDFSFVYEPFSNNINFSFEINFITISINDNKEIFQINGFCPLPENRRENFEIPKYITGILKILGDFEPGYTYKLTEGKEWNICLNNSSDWIRIGLNNEYTNNVKIAKDCIISLNSNNEICSIFVKLNMINYT